MSQFGPFETRVEIMERTAHFIDLVLRNTDPNITAWRIYGHRNLNDAYGDPVRAAPLFLPPGTSNMGGSGPVVFVNQVGREQGFRSPLLIQRQLGRLESRAQLRRMSRVMFDPDDYTSVPEMPSENESLYVRVQEFAMSVGGWRTVLGPDDHDQPILGPIVVVPTANLYRNPRGPLSITGNAPANTLAVGGGIVPLHEDSQTPNPMHIILPRPSTVKIRNMGSVALLYAFELEQPMETLPSGGEEEVIGGVKELLLASSDNSGGAAVTPAFNITAIVNLGVTLDG